MIALQTIMRALLLLTLLAVALQVDTSGSIEFTVRDSATRKGIPAVRAVLTFLPESPPNVSTFSFTDENGRIVFRGLAPGNYVVRLDPKVGYLSTATPDFAETLIAPDRQSTRREVFLTPVAEITGRVLNWNRDPVPKVRVRAMYLSYQDGERSLTTAPAGANSAVAILGDDTDDRGEYRLSGLPPGEYYLRVDNSELMAGTKPVNLPRVTYYPGMTSLATANPVILRGQDLSAMDIRIDRAEAHSISGVVNFGAVAGASRGLGFTFNLVSAQPNSIKDPTLIFASGTPLGDRESAFEIRGVVPGIYHLYPLLDYSIDGRRGYATARTLVTVGDRDVQGLRIVPSPPPEVKGKLFVDGDSSGIKWDAVSIGASPREWMPVLIRSVSFLNAVVANPETREFILPSLIPDVRWIVRVSGLPQDAYISDVRQGGFSVYNDGVRSNSSDGSVEVVIGRQGGVLSGIVRDTANQVVAQVPVALVPNEPRRRNIHLYQRATTDSRGQFVFRGIAPGEYKLFAWSSLSGTSEQNEQFLSLYDVRGTSVSINGGISENVQLAVLPAR